jgi:uncharacterized membrane protein YccC
VFYRDQVGSLVQRGMNMNPSEQLQRELEDLAFRSRQNIEEVIAQSQAAIDQFEQIKWFLAAETTAAEHVGRLIEHRDHVVRGVLDRLNVRQLSSPPQPEPLVAHNPAPPSPPPQRPQEDDIALSEVIRHINNQRQQQRYG